MIDCRILEGGSYMAEAYIHINDVRPGFMLMEDVYVNTKYPIICKDTEISARHIEVLKAFGVKKIKIEEPDFLKKEEIGQDEQQMVIDPDQLLAAIPISKSELKMQYIEAILKFKKEFLGWSAGIRPQVPKVRSIIMPLIKTVIDEKQFLLELNNFSDTKDYIYHHSIAVGILSAHIAKEMDYSMGEVLQIGLAGALADCGMAKIDPKILNKDAFLSKDEFNEVKKHTIYSYQMIQDTSLLRSEMKRAIFQHHERLDGSGYPKGIKMGDIPVFSQIIAVADVFHAMTSERVYRSKESPYKVIEMITEEEFGKFDIQVVNALQKLIGDFTIGQHVQLTNGDIGEIMFLHRDSRLRPIIRKIKDQSIIDLAANRQLAIDKILLN